MVHINNESAFMERPEFCRLHFIPQQLAGPLKCSQRLQVNACPGLSVFQSCLKVSPASKVFHGVISGA